MSRRVLALVLLVAAAAAAAPLQGQDRSERAREAMTRGIRAYQDLDFDLAAALLRNALATGLDDSAHATALIYLAAADHYRGQHDSTVAVFRRLAALAPEYQPDTLVFPPEITRTYTDVRSRMPVVALAVAPPPPAPPPPPPPSGPAPADTQPVRVSLTEPATGRGIVASGAALAGSVHARSSDGLPNAAGPVLGLIASARLGRFELGVKYLEGSLGSRDLVEGAALLRFQTTSWLTVQAGSQIRRYETPFGTERWVVWPVGARADVPIRGTGVRAHALLWRGLGLSVNVPPGSGTATGAEAGVTVDVGRGPFWFALAYSIDQASLEGTSRRETVAALLLSAGIR